MDKINLNAQDAVNSKRSVLKEYCIALLAVLVFAWDA
jgi:hypothetical protein